MLPGLIGWLFVLIAIGMVLYEKHLEKKAGEAQFWPVADGEITHSEVVRQGGAGLNTSSTFKADVKYKYKIKSRTLRGNKVRLGVDIATGSRTRAEERCAQFPVGRTVEVHYNPDKPAECCLEPVADATQLVYIFAACFGFMGFGVVSGLIRF